MRVLLIAMLVLGALFGVVGQELMRLRKLADQQRAIIARLEAKGARLEIEFQGNRSYAEPLLRALEGKPFPDVGSALLLKGEYNVDDIRELASLSGLRHITIDSDRCTDAWLNELANAPELWSVTIESNAYGPAGAIALAKSPSRIAHLVLLGSSVDDEFLKKVAQQPDLEQLVIQGEGITAEGLPALRAAKNLWDLRLHGGTTLGGGFKQLGEHPSLKMLVLRDYEWTTDSDLDGIAKMQTLSSLCIESPRLPKGVLQAAAKLRNLNALQLIGEFAENEPIESLQFTKLEIYSAGPEGRLCPGLFERLALCKSLHSIDAPGGTITAEDLSHLAKLPKLDQLTIGTSPSKEAIKQFQRSQPYCVYIDGQWGVFQPRIGINPSRMGGGGIYKDSIVAPESMKPSR